MMIKSYLVRIGNNNFPNEHYSDEELRGVIKTLKTIHTIMGVSVLVKGMDKTYLCLGGNDNGRYTN